ncbi:DUF3828 domain-containing protein [Devosia sp.]|uniref:DUF3828 domain-containing protein n=1 Tax=Devosia sp. TaxID=1871048 RepID=UPI0032652CC9
MRLMTIVAALVLSFSSAAMAASYDTPEAMLNAFYAPYLANSIPEDEESFRSQALQALYDADAAATPEGEMGALDFDPFINGQDWTLTDFKIGKAKISGDTAKVQVTFNNFDTPTVLVYDLVNEGGWKIDDVVSTDGDVQYSLVEIFNNGGEAE